MSALLPTVVWLPFVLALVPALPPATTTARRLGALAVLVAGLTTAIAVWSLTRTAAFGSGGANAIWRDDAPARIMMLVSALCWLLVAIRTLQPGEAVRLQAGRWRRWPVAGQLAVACAMALCRGDLLAMLPVLLGVLILLAPRLENDGGPRTAWLAAIPLMAMGVAILSMQARVPAHWGMMAAQSSRQVLPGVVLLGVVLLVAPMLLLAAAIMIRPVLASRTAPLRGLLQMLVLVCAAIVALRGCVAAAVGPVVLLIGLGWIVLSLLLIPACRTLGQRVSLAAMLQGGAALVAIASGGAGGIAAATMLIGFLLLLLPLASSFPVDTVSGRLRAAALVVMVGVPPFGPFAAGLVLLVRLSGQHVALALFLLFALAASALSVLDAARRDPAVGPGWRFTPWTACTVLVLAVALWLGLAMPAALSDWLLAIGAARA